MATRFRRTLPTEADVYVPRRRRTAAKRIADHYADRTAKGRPTTRVYYFRRPDGAVKIGTTEHLAARMRHLRANPAGQLLATEPGWYAEEAARHRQFAAHALGGEWFATSPELERLITSLAGTA